MYYLVTVKLPKNPEHDPRNKKQGDCPVNGKFCSDITGQHHTVFVPSPDDDLTPEYVTATFTAKGFHVTRVEEV
jgi:hypothetical protein